jgi:hypothetical protein
MSCVFFLIISAQNSEIGTNHPNKLQEWFYQVVKIEPTGGRLDRAALETFASSATGGPRSVWSDISPLREIR